MTSAFEVQPGIGVGSIRFGMRPTTVRRSLPEATLYEAWMGGNLNDALLFHGLRLHFDACDLHGPLSSSGLNLIVIHQREDAILFERSCFEWTRDSVQVELQSRQLEFKLERSGDILVAAGMSLSFDRESRLTWIEMEQG